jgi:hypothetical protein
MYYLIIHKIQNILKHAISQKLFLILLIIILFIICIICIICIILYLQYNKEKFNNIINATNATNDYNIPKIIYLCYKHKQIPDYIIPNWQILNSNYKIILYDNQDCIQFLNENYGEEYVNIFNFIKDGPIKADFWRCCILYKYGGVYADIDTKPIMPIDKLLEPDLELLTVRSGNNVDGDGDGITPELIICKKNNLLLDLCIKTYIKYMREQKPYDYWGWSIVNIMRNNFKLIITTKMSRQQHIYLDKQNKKYKLIDEVLDSNSYNDKVICNNEIVLYNRYETYDKDAHVF